MTAKLRSPRLLASVIFAAGLVIGFACLAPGHGLRTAAAQGSAPLGSYGYMVGQAGSTAILGVMNFDGAGNVTGSYTSSNPSGAGGSGTLTGTYTISGSGSGTATLAFDFGLTVTAALAVTDSGAGLEILFTSGAPGINGVARRQ